MTRDATLRSIKILHTVIWAFFVLCIAAIPIFGYFDRFVTAALLVGVVMLEVLVLLLNGMRCPLTGAASHYTEDRRDNFDIYLPAWLAKHNQSVFGTLFVLGALYMFARWAGATHALLVWSCFVPLAVANGAFRQSVLIPEMGEQVGHVVSTVLLSAVILLVTWFALPWIGPAEAHGAWRLGAYWLALTLAFEFLAGHYLFHTPWSKLRADYNIARGRIWLLVLLATFFAPILAFEFRN